MEILKIPYGYFSSVITFFFYFLHNSAFQVSAAVRTAGWPPHFRMHPIGAVHIHGGTVVQQTKPFYFINNADKNEPILPHKAMIVWYMLWPYVTVQHI